MLLLHPFSCAWPHKSVNAVTAPRAGSCPYVKRGYWRHALFLSVHAHLPVISRSRRKTSNGESEPDVASRRRIPWPSRLVKRSVRRAECPRTTTSPLTVSVGRPSYSVWLSLFKESSNFTVLTSMSALQRQHLEAVRAHVEQLKQNGNDPAHYRLLRECKLILLIPSFVGSSCTPCTPRYEQVSFGETANG